MGVGYFASTTRKVTETDLNVEKGILHLFPCFWHERRNKFIDTGKEGDSRGLQGKQSSATVGESKPLQFPGNGAWVDASLGKGQLHLGPGAPVSWRHLRASSAKNPVTGMGEGQPQEMSRVREPSMVKSAGDLQSVVN